MKSRRTRKLSTLGSIAVVVALSACATEQTAVIEKLDDLTAVTYTYSRTPIILSPDTPLDRENTRDYVQIGAIEVNRMGTLQYYLWLGISEMNYEATASKQPEGFESIVIDVGGEKIPLDVLGWTENAIGVSEPVYKKLFSTSVDAYYQVTLEQIQLLNEVDGIKLLTTGSEPREFVSWYRQDTAKDDLAEFLQSVTQ